MAIVRNTIKFSSGGGSDITVVANYSALPDPTTVAGQFYWCSASQGVEWTPDWAWLPLSLGDPYYPKGQYYSNGTTWEYAKTPFQATQSEVNTGTNTDKFVTPNTLANSDWSFTTAKVLATLLTGLSLTTGGEIVSTDSILVAFGKIQKQINDLLATGSRLITTTEITKLSNTSGTNSGDNATNTTSNAYADAKVEDTIVNGVTDKAPSQNKVFDAFNNLDPLVKRRYFDDLQGFGNGAVANSIFFGTGQYEQEGNIFVTRVGIGATFARTPAEVGRGGIIRGGTGTTIGGINLIQFRSIWLGTEDFVSQTAVRIQNLSDATNRFTLVFTNGVGVTNSMRFFYSDNVNSGKWQCETYLSSVSTLVDSGVSVSANTWYDLKLCRIGMVCYFYINNVLVAAISTNIPSGIESFCGTTFTKTAGTTSRTCDFDYLKFFDL